MAKEWWEDAPLAPQADSDAGDWWQEAPLESETKPKARTWGEAAKDGASSFGASVNNTLKTLTDLAGTNNSASEFLEENAKTWQGNYSPVYKAELQKQASEKAALGDDPSYAARAGLMAKQVVRNPIEGVGELAGNIAPMVVGGVAGLGVKGMAALSAAMGAGAVKGGIAETVQNAPDIDLMLDPLYAEMRSSGMSEKEAKAALSEQRASYGDAYGKILLGAGIGAAVGRFGSVENAIANMGKRTAAQAQTGLLKGVGTGVAKEVVTEIPQEMTETYLGNKGAASQGASIAADQGVIESGVKAGILSAVGGGVAGMTGRGAIQPVPQATPADIMAPSVTSVDQAIAISQAALNAGRQFQELGLTQPANDLAMQRQISEARDNLAARAQLHAEEQAAITQAQSERDGAVASQARDQRLSEAGQAWQDLGIANPTDDLQAQRVGMRGNQDVSQNPDLQSLPTVSPGRGSAEPGVGLETALGRDGAGGQRLGAGLPGTVPPGESVAPASRSNADAVAPSAPVFDSKRNADGTLTVFGDIGEISAAGITGPAKYVDGKPAAILVSVSNAPKVEAQLEATRVQNQTPRADAAPAQARAQAPAVGAATGQAAEPVAGSGAVQAVNQPQGTPNGTQATQAQQSESSAPAQAASDPRLTTVSQRTPKPIDPRLIPVSQRAALTGAQSEQVDAANADDFERLYQADVKESIARRLGRAIEPSGARQRQTPFRSFLREFGIDSSLANDVHGGGAVRANNALPATFRRGGRSLDDLVTLAVERGFMQASDVESGADNGGTNRLVQMIQAEIRGEQQVSSEFASEDAQTQQERVQRLEIERVADKLGLPYSADTSTDRLASMVNRVQERLKKEVGVSWDGRGALKQDRVLRNARETVARIERKRAQYEREMQAFAALNIAEQDALLEILEDSDGDPVIVRKADMDAEAAWAQAQGQWSEQNGQTDAAQDGVAQQDQTPSTGVPEEGAGRAAQDRTQTQSRSPEAPAGQEGLTAPTRADVLAQQAQREAEEQRQKDGGDKPIERKVTADQVDLFNTQGSVFDAPAEPSTPTAARTSPKETIVFKTAITGPSGAKLVAYTWQWRPMDTVDARGEDRTVRVSDWDKSEINAETGRDVVHQFQVVDTDGAVKVVSAETAIKELGYGSSELGTGVKSVVTAAKTLARLKMQIAETEQTLAAFKADSATVNAMAIPHMPLERNDKGWFVLGDAQVRQIETGPMLDERRKALISAWRDNRLSEMGWKNGSFLGESLSSNIGDLNDRIKRAEKRLASTVESAKPSTPFTHINGDRAEYTGKTETLHGGLFYEVMFTEGAKSGTTAVTQRAPDGTNAGQRGPKASSGIVTPQIVPAKPASEMSASELLRAAADKMDAEKSAAKAERIEDSGQKIGGARKDRWKERGMDLSDLDSMSESEGAEMATKANVWKPDYDAMAEATEPVTAAMVKTVYDQLAAQPKKNTPEGRRNYVTMMQSVRKAYLEAKSPDDVKNAGQKIKTEIGLYSTDPATKARAREVLFSVYKGRSDPFVLSYNELSKAKKMVEDGFPAKGEPWKKRLGIRAYGGKGITPHGIELTLSESAELGTPLTTDQIASGFYRISNKDGKAVGYAPTKEDAEATAKTIYERDLKKGAADKPEPVRPNLDELKRENLPGRIDRDVTADDFVNDLGFRGVEFGNWAAQDERQRIINMAYDGLMDLAEIMGVPPKAMSLNGTMGMAFGARGGGKFAAHYEPGKLVINMTKINGGGSMAHEWAHALDHYFGELNQKDAYTTKARGASGWYDEQQYKGVPQTRMEKDAAGKWVNVTKMRLSNMRPEMAKAFDGVMSALFSGQETKAQMVRSEELSIERYQALADKETDADTKAMYLRGIESRKMALEELRQDPEDKTYPKGRSAYAGQAQKLVGKSATGYWTRPTEMFARAFESWVFDKVAAMGARSDYLVHGVEEDRFAGGNYKGNPYPTGPERASINAAFDTLAGTIQTKEDDAGNVAMFSRADSIDVSDPRTGISSVLLELGKLNSLYQYPRSSKPSLEGIAADKGMTISDVDRNTEDGKLWMIANTTPTDAPGVKSWIVTLPGGKHATLTDKNGEVYINVASVGEGQGGSRVYDLAANYAFNNGLKFIGDPNGVSPAAMRRRLENMLSAAIKYGSTDFLAPHTDQVEGRPDIGVPALRWTEGDTLGNIRSMVDVSVASTKSTNPVSTQDVRFDPATHTLRDGGNHVVDARRLSEMLGDEERTRGTGQAGNTTLRRNALFNSLLQSVGNRTATMEFIHREQDRGGSGIGGALEGSFYSHAAVRNPSTVERVQSAVAELIGGKQLPNQLGRVVATTAAEIKSHWEALIDKSVNIGSEGDAGVAQAFYDPRTKTVFLIADHISQGNETAVLAHELMHKHGAAVLGKDGWARLHGVISSWEHAPADSEEHAVYSYARNKVAAVGEHLSSQEMLPYCVEAALKMGIQPSMAAKKGTVARWLESVRQNMRMVWGKITGKPESFRTQDLVDLAFGIAQRENPAHAGISLEAGGEPTAPDGGGAMFSRTGIVGQTSRQHTPEQLRAMANVGFQVEVPTLKERAQALWKDAGKKMAQGIVDQFAPVKALDGTAYGLLRLAKGASGAFEAFLHGGKLKLTDGVYDFDETNKGGVIDKLLIPLQGEHHDFMRWVAANRAERLQSEGKENLFSTQDIADLKTLASGTAGFDYTVQTGPGAGRVTRDRTLIYADSLRVFNAFNKNILDMAEQSGLIDGASRQVWEHEFYVPFYRVADEDGGGVRGMNIKGSVVRQQAFKELKGGKNALNADLLDNTLMNWAHLLDASAKNRAAKATIEAAEALGVATGGNQSTLAQMGASVKNKNGVVWFMDGGQKRYSLIDKDGDGPYLMTAISALEYAGMRNPVMNAMSFFKHALTVGVTASPFFKVRNLIRDSVQVIGTSGINANPLANVAQGWKLTDPKSDAYFRLLAGGGTIHFGAMLEGSEAKRIQALVESGVDDATILGDQHKVKAFYRKFIEPGITAYNELGNRGEAINRASLYDQLVRGGMSHADASLQARDLMDFSMQGSSTSIRFLTQVVPFFNARLQGMYKLGRAAKEDPARFGAVLGATALFSIALLAAYGDDDDWKERTESDRNNFWWFKFGGIAFRIPKPFEIGAIATLAERGFELAFDKQMTSTRFRKQVLALLSDNLSMNPVPQMVKPILDVYANKDSFSGMSIESMGMDKLKSEYRFNDRTSMTARGLSTAGNSITGLAGLDFASPVQIDHMLRGYFGWLGTFVVSAGDKLARPATGQTSQATPDYWKIATGNMVSDLRDAPSRYVAQMYEQAKEVEQAYGTYRMLQKSGKAQEAAEFAAEHRSDLMKHRGIERVKQAESKLNERIRIIERSSMDGDKKRDLIRQIKEQKNRVAKTLAP